MTSPIIHLVWSGPTHPPPPPPPPPSAKNKNLHSLCFSFVPPPEKLMAILRQNFVGAGWGEANKEY